MSNESVVAIERRDDFILAAVNVSEMDEQSSRCLLDTVTSSVAEAGSLPIVLDLSNVNFLPSASLGVLVKLQNESRQGGLRFILVGLQPQIREVLALTRLDKLFDIHESVDDARTHLSTTPD